MFGIPFAAIYFVQAFIASNNRACQLVLINRVALLPTLRADVPLKLWIMPIILLVLQRCQRAKALIAPNLVTFKKEDRLSVLLANRACAVRVWLIIRLVPVSRSLRVHHHCTASSIFATIL